MTKSPDDTVPDTESTATFESLGLPEAVVKTLHDAGVSTPFPIQAATIPDALSGKDVIGRGRTGSGKTLSFGLPSLVRMSTSSEETQRRRPRGLVLTPTRELAMQVADSLDPYAKVLGVNMKVVCGGISMTRQISALENGVDMLVATPGRLKDLMDRGVCQLDNVAITVLDEADRMADMGFLPEVIGILDKVPSAGQRMLFSATLEEEVATLVDRYLSEPATHEVDPSAGAVTTMTHHVLVVNPRLKAEVTAAVAGVPGRAIAFARTQLGTDRIATQLREAGVGADALHGGMTQQARTAVLDRFKSGELKVLVATDVAARGIHVDDVDVVVNVDPARDGKDYLHRAGRTARAGRSGTVVSLALPHQWKTTTRMLERIDVKATRHFVEGVFDAEVAQLLGAHTFTELRAEAVAREAEAAQAEADSLIARAEGLTRKAAGLNGDAARLRDRAEQERAGTVPLAEPSRAPRQPKRDRPGGGGRGGYSSSDPKRRQGGRNNQGYRGGKGTKPGGRKPRRDDSR